MIPHEARDSVNSSAGDLIRVRKETGHAASVTQWEVTALAYYDSIYQDQELGLQAKAVYIYLKGHADKGGICWPGINTIAAGVSLSRSTVKRALDDLVRAGLVVQERRWRGNGSLTSNLYYVLPP